jgi:hypothetical protein
MASTRKRAQATNSDEGAAAPQIPAVPKSAIPPGAQQVVVVQDARQIGRATTAEEMKQLRKNPPDRAKQPGGYFLDPVTHTAHDGDGNPVELRSEDEDTLAEYRQMRGIPEPSDVDRLTDPNDPSFKGGTEPAPKELRSMNVAQLRQIAQQRGMRVIESGADAKEQYLKALGAGTDK